MSWASQFWKHNRDFIGNAAKNLAPAAFLIPGIGPGAAALIGGLGSAAGRGIQHGANLGNILKQGATGAAIGYGGAQGMNALKVAFAPSSSAAGTIAAQGASGAAEAPGSFISGVEGSGPGYAASAGGAATPTSTLSQLASGFGSKASALGHFAQANPMAAAMGLQGLGQIGSMGAENAYKKAQTDQLNHQNQMSDYEMQMLKQRQAALAPLLAAFQGQAYRPAGNPYSTGTNPYSSANPYT